MNIFDAALKAVVPHFKVRGHTLFIAQGNLYERTEIDLRKLAAHRKPSVTKIQIRLFRGRWRDYSLVDFRPREVAKLCALLTHWEKQNRKRPLA